MAIVGDVSHSRVARSNIYALDQTRSRGACGGASDDDSLAIEKLGVKVYYNMDEGLRGVMSL